MGDKSVVEVYVIKKDLLLHLPSEIRRIYYRLTSRIVDKTLDTLTSPTLITSILYLFPLLSQPIRPLTA